MKSKACMIFKTRSIYSIGTLSFTVKGYRTLTQPNFQLPIDALPKKIIENIFLALEAVKEEVPVPLNEEEGAILMGFKSYAELHKTSKCCVIELVDNELSISPTKNYIRSRAFDFLGHLEEKLLIHDSEEEIFLALDRAFENCQ